jgi:hypothetical protein
MVDLRAADPGRRPGDVLPLPSPQDIGHFVVARTYRQGHGGPASLVVRWRLVRARSSNGSAPRRAFGLFYLAFIGVTWPGCGGSTVHTDTPARSATSRIRTGTVTSLALMDAAPDPDTL